MKNIIRKGIFFVLLIMHNLFTIAQQAFFEGSLGVVTPLLPVIFVNNNKNILNMNFKLNLGKTFLDKAASFNTSVSFYNWSPGTVIVLCPYFKTTFGKKFQFYLYGGPFGSFLVIDNYITSTTKFNHFYWGLNIGIGLKFIMSKQLYLFLDFRESIALSPVGLYKSTRNGSFQPYYVYFGNPTIGVGYLFKGKSKANSKVE